MAALPAPLAAPLIATRRRLRLQAALETGAAALVLGGAVFAVAVYLARLDVVSLSALRFSGVGIAAAVLLSSLAAAMAPQPLAAVALRIDTSHSLHDRIGNALAFLDAPAPTELMRAAVADALKVAARVEPRRAAPLTSPKALRAAVGSCVAASLVLLLYFPARVDAAKPTPPTQSRRFVVADDVLAAERAAADALKMEAQRDNDAELERVADDIKNLLQQLEAKELTRKDVFDEIDQIEARLEARAGEFARLKEKVKAASPELGEAKLSKEVAKALAKEDLAKAKKELEAMAREAERLAAERDKRGSETRDQERDRQTLAKALAKASEAVEHAKQDAERQKQEHAADDQLDREIRAKKEEQRRLKKELAEKNDEETRRKLERNQRELERLEREKQERQEARRQLERLQKEMEKAAEELRQKLSPEALEALKKMAEQMGKMEQEIKKLGGSGAQMRKVNVRIAELKESMRRGGQSKDGQGDQQAENGQPKPGDGKQGKNGEAMRDFNQRAGETPTVVIDPNNPNSNPGGDTILLPLPGMGQAQQKPGQRGQEPGKPDNEKWGDEHDPNTLGSPSQIAANYKNSKVKGKEGAGPSRSETILGSAQKGFATSSYKRVYSDYSSVVEEVMQKERVPPGYRFYVKRYFRLIKPRE